MLRIDNLIPISDTWPVKSTKNENSLKSPWQKTKYANLVRYKPSGMYFARVRIGGKLIRESLKTDSVTVAKDRLDELEKRERRTLQRQQEIAKGRMTFGDALAMYKMRIQGDPDLKPRTKSYYEERISALLKSWPELDRKDVRKITETECKNWGAKYAPTISPNAFNHTLAILKHTLAIGVEVGARHDNPAANVKRASEQKKKLTLPSGAEFEALVDSVRHAGGGRSKHCADLILFLAYGGFRITEAANILWRDIDRTKKTILVRGDDETATKNGEWRYVPITGDMAKLLDRLWIEHGQPSLSSPVMKVRECQKAIDSAIKRLANPAITDPPVMCPRITHHDLRHLFATRCIESDVPIATVAHWMGHKDGGVLALRTYGHLRQEHSVSMADRVQFHAKPTPIATAPTSLGQHPLVESFNVLSRDEDSSEIRQTA